jgi:hypothetical protein
VRLGVGRGGERESHPLFEVMRFGFLAFDSRRLLTARSQRTGTTTGEDTGPTPHNPSRPLCVRCVSPSRGVHTHTFASRSSRLRGGGSRVSSDSALGLVVYIVMNADCVPTDHDSTGYLHTRGGFYT